MKIKIFEAFAGYGSQFEAAKRVWKDNVESIGIMEIDPDAILAYALIHHNEHFNSLLSLLQNSEKEEIEEMKKHLKGINIGYDFRKQKSKIDNMKKDKLIKLYVACQVTGNFGDISLANNKKLGTNIDLFTYSFPCTDISVSGKLEGIKEGTRSGLLWECEKFIEINKPKVLLMENVKNLIGKSFKEDFNKWIKKLEELGYKNTFKVLNAKHYGIPQNRERVFMVSTLDDSEYCFPEPFELKTRLKDILENNVDEKYYLKGDAVDKLILDASKRYDIKNQETKFIIDDTMGFEIEARIYDKCSPTLRAGRNGLKTIEAKLDMLGMLDIKGNESIRRVYGTDGLSPTLTTMQGGNRQPKIMIETPCIVASRGRNPENSSDRTTGAPTEQRLEANNNGTTNTLTTVQKDNYVLDYLPIKNATKKGYIEAYEGDYVNLQFPDSKTRRGRVQKDLSGTLMCNDQNGVVAEGFRIRKLTPYECWKLMGMENDSFEKIKDYCSDSVIYKLTGNSIVVNTLESIFKEIKIPLTE